MAHHVNTTIKAGDKRGFPIYKTDVEVPRADTIYDPLLDIPDYKPHMPKPHSDVPFLRAASLNKVVEVLKNMCLYPISVRPGDMPTGQAWNNFPQVVNTAHVVYCDLQGYSRTSIMARCVYIDP